MDTQCKEEYETYVEEWDGYDDELLSFEEWLKQEEEYDRQLQEYNSDEYAEAMEKALQEDYEMQQELGADNYAGDYMVQSDVARIMDSAARLTMMTPPDETYSEWWKSQSVVADKIELITWKTAMLTKPTAWMPKLLKPNL